MSLFSDPKRDNTIPDEKWDDLQRKAVKANPHLDSFTDDEAIKRRKAAAEQRGKSLWS